MFIEFNEASAKESTGNNAGSKILETGVYDVKIVTASKCVASTGTIGIDWALHVEGSKYPNMCYNMWVKKSNGDNIFNMNTVQALLGILGAKGLTEFDKTIDTKDGSKTVKAFKELDGVTCKVAVQKVFDYYNGEVREKNEIKSFFSEDGKTFAEMKSNGAAKQLEYYSTKLKDNKTAAYKAAEANGELNGEETSEDNSAEEESSGSLL